MAKNRKNKGASSGKGSSDKAARPSLNIRLEPDAQALFAAALKGIDEQTVLEQKAASDGAKSKADGRREAPFGKALEREIDLHGLTLVEAQDAVCAFLDRHLEMSRGKISLCVITGKGKRSEGGPGVLAREIHGFVKARYEGRILSIDASPAETEIRTGILLRGFFKLVLDCG